jgi:hypothetical protein
LKQRKEINMKRNKEKDKAIRSGVSVKEALKLVTSAGGKGDGRLKKGGKRRKHTDWVRGSEEELSRNVKRNVVGAK